MHTSISVKRTAQESRLWETADSAESGESDVTSWLLSTAYLGNLGVFTVVLRGFYRGLGEQHVRLLRRRELLLLEM